MPLTKRQKEILDFLEGFMSENGYAPSFEEIARQGMALQEIAKVAVVFGWQMFVSYMYEKNPHWKPQEQKQTHAFAAKVQVANRFEFRHGSILQELLPTKR